MLQALLRHANRSAHPCANCSLTPVMLLPGMLMAMLLHLPDSGMCLPESAACHSPTEP
jgi:hypothetical protein